MDDLMARAIAAVGRPPENYSGTPEDYAIGMLRLSGEPPGGWSKYAQARSPMIAAWTKYAQTHDAPMDHFIPFAMGHIAGGG